MAGDEFLEFQIGVLSLLKHSHKPTQQPDPQVNSRQNSCPAAWSGISPPNPPNQMYNVGRVDQAPVYPTTDQAVQACPNNDYMSNISTNHIQDYEECCY
jgi:hypothetical protein